MGELCTASCEQDAIDTLKQRRIQRRDSFVSAQLELVSLHRGKDVADSDERLCMPLDGVGKQGHSVQQYADDCVSVLDELEERLYTVEVQKAEADAELTKISSKCSDLEVKLGSVTEERNQLRLVSDSKPRVRLSAVKVCEPAAYSTHQSETSSTTCDSQESYSTLASDGAFFAGTAPTALMKSPYKKKNSISVSSQSTSHLDVVRRSKRSSS